MQPPSSNDPRTADPSSFRDRAGSRNSRKQPARRRGPLTISLALLALLAALVPLLPWLLSASTTLPTHAAVIYVFPGQVPDRAECAARLFRQGVSLAVVFSGANVRPELAAIGQPLPDAEVNARIAGEHGVPADARVVLREGTSTWEDAHVLAKWMSRQHARSVIAVTSPIHSRRALWTLELALRSEDVEISLASCGADPGVLWWQSERSLIELVVEILKLGYYAIVHFLPAVLWGAPAQRAMLPAHGE